MKRDKKLEDSLDQWVDKQYKDLLPSPAPTHTDTEGKGEQQMKKHGAELIVNAECIALCCSTEKHAARIVTCWNEHDSLKAENEKVKRLLHDLTPGGSEFHNDPEYCAKWVRDEREESVRLLKDTIKDLKAANNDLIGYAEYVKRIVAKGEKPMSYEAYK